MRKLAFFLMFLCSLSFLAGFSFKEAKATTLTISRTFQSLTSDGMISRYDIGPETYTDIWNAASGNVDDAVSQINVGQWDLLEIYRAFIPFDTSPLPDNCTVTSIDVSIRLAVNLSSQDFNVTVQNGMPNHPELPLQSGDYSKAFYSGAGGSRNTSTITTMNYWNITLNSTGLGWIDVDGTTKFCLRSNREISGIEPATYEFITFYSAEMGASYAPILYVTYETEGYRYIVHGPYSENGTVANAFVNITFSIQNMDSNSTYLNGTDGVVDTLDFQVEQKGVSFTWNISASGYNYTRIVMLKSDTFEEIYIFIPNSAEVANIYYFNFIDLVGVTNGYLETRITFNGSSTIVERQKADVYSLKPFWLTWNHHYDVRLVCDQGSYTWSDQVATEPYTWTFAVNSGMFPVTLPGMNLTIYAERKNHTYIQVNYSDAESLTSWVNVAFKHKLNGVYVTDYSLNQTGNSVQVNWYSADEDFGYRILVQYYRNGTTESGYLFVNQLPSDALVFEGQLDLLGLFPFDSRQLIGIFILFIIGTIFTYEDVVIGGFTILILAAFLNLIGFLAIGWTLIGVGFIIVFLAALANAKRGVA
jgi:hypothetical protein